MKLPRFLAPSLAGLAVAASVAAAPAPARADDDSFFLKDGDRVVFFGDSITEQRLYTTFTETFAVTRFPKYDLNFTHSGWGGDRVGGGGGGSIDRRLARDVVAYRPSVVTVMLGMNDARYRAFDQEIFDRYASGYRHIVEELKLDLPGVRMTLIVPSPFDDVTREPRFEGGYNAVLVRYGDFLKELGASEKVEVADMNAPVVAATRKAKELEPDNAQKLNPDRIHPAPGGQLIMAQALLKDWHAPSLVSSVFVDAKGPRILSADKAELTDLAREGDILRWTELDASLPFPIDARDPVVALAVKASDFQNALNRQVLKVDGLATGDYTLSIDGDEVATYSNDDLNVGVNLAEKATPMSKQAARVHELTVKHVKLHHMRWRDVQIPYQTSGAESLGKAMEGLDGMEAEIVADQHALAQPVPHRFELKPKR